MAERDLQLRKPGGTDSAVRIRIGRPYPSGDDWQCPYEIDAPGLKRTFAIYGVDSVQALALALKAVDVELEVIAKQAGGSLLWLDEPFTSLQHPADPKRSK
jgi:hypothetical protein